ncbi:MAG TPA: ABC transporter substrate-binding protein [Stellaceae bacterium]|jgi:phospholipid transport system substrate-binding protein|nr:ABC transporter substrate-binding protein [Stellaceae bacterium]
MLVSRRFLFGLPMLLAAARPVFAADSGGGAAVIQRFYDTLLAVMRQARQLRFDQRYAQLAPAIEQAFDLGLMARLAVGPGWAQMTPDQQQRVAAAFGRYTISVYASRFDDYGGERFQVDPTAAANAHGTLVKSWLIKTNGEKIVLNYLMRPDAAGGWKIIDVYLSGTISELATRRSEFASVLQKGGADGLARMLDQRAASLRTG